MPPRKSDPTAEPEAKAAEPADPRIGEFIAFGVEGVMSGDGPEYVVDPETGCITAVKV